MNHWVEHVPAKSLERGLGYFESGRVRAVSKETDGWRATVSGTNEYVAFVPDSLDPRLAQCTCPHFDDGNICKHIAAAFFAVDRKLGAGKGGGSVLEPVEEIVARVDCDSLKAFVIELARCDESFERELRATFGTADVKQAKRELQKTTTALTRQFERRGFIDWRDAMDFDHEYAVAVESIMRPFLSSQDVDSLIELATPRLVQVQRICIDDSDGFFSGALADIVEHLNCAFAWGHHGQRQRLFEALGDFIEKNPGKDRGSIYWFEQEVIEAFLADRFSQDVQFAPQMIELADEHLSRLPPAPENGYDRNRHERVQWGESRLKAMAALGETPDALRAYAKENGLLESADVVRLLADAYVSGGLAQQSMRLLRENLNAVEPYRRFGMDARPPRIVDCLVEMANKECDEEELAELYFFLLHHESSRSIGNDDLESWYESLRRIVDDGDWVGLRKKLFDEIPSSTVNTCLAYEGALEELYEHIMDQGGADLMRFERVLSEKYPEPYVEYHIECALSLMGRAGDRRLYREVAAELARAAGLPGGQDRAQEAASALGAEYPRRSAMLDELRSAGFVV